ncbi:MAG: hypothetical protein ACLR3C_18230 [Eggerthella lenta]
MAERVRGLLVGVFAWMLVERVRRLRLAAEQVRDLEVQVRAAEAGLRHLRSGEEATRRRATTCAIMRPR